MYGLIKKLYDTRQSVHASTASALSEDILGRRQALEAIAGTAIGLKSLFSLTATEAADWGSGVQAIKKVIPDGEYETRVWNSETAKTEQYFLIIVNKKGGTKVPFGNEAAWTITDLGMMTPAGIEKYVVGTYSRVADNPSELSIEAEKLKNGELVYIVRKKDVRPKISWGKLYLDGAGSAQSGGAGAGGAGAGAGGGSGAGK